MLCDQASDEIIFIYQTNHLYSSARYYGVCPQPGARSALSTTPNGPRVCAARYLPSARSIGGLPQ